MTDEASRTLDGIHYLIIFDVAGFAKFGVAVFLSLEFLSVLFLPVQVEVLNGDSRQSSH